MKTYLFEFYSFATQGECDEYLTSDLDAISDLTPIGLELDAPNTKEALQMANDQISRISKYFQIHQFQTIN